MSLDGEEESRYGFGGSKRGYNEGMLVDEEGDTKEGCRWMEKRIVGMVWWINTRR